jgi:hypothetical protein
VLGNALGLTDSDGESLGIELFEGGADGCNDGNAEGLTLGTVLGIELSVGSELG